MIPKVRAILGQLDPNDVRKNHTTMYFYPKNEHYKINDTFRTFVIFQCQAKNLNQTMQHEYKNIWKYRISTFPLIRHLRQVTKFGAQLYVLTIESQILINRRYPPCTIDNMPPTLQTQS